MICAAITARSRAVLLWPASVRPVTFLKLRVLQAPGLGLAVHHRDEVVDACRPRASASTTEASLPDCTIMP